MAKPEKVAAVAEIAESLRSGEGVVLTDYRGLNVKSMTELRGLLREAGVQYKVVKNTLTSLAAKEVGIEGLDELLVGPTAIAVGRDDPTAAARILGEFARRNPALEIKGGVLKGRVIDVQGVKSLGDLPPREVLLAQVLRGMQAPIAGLVNVLSGPARNLVYALEAIRKQKEAA